MSEETTSVRFGFDLGTNSIGWAVLGLGGSGEPEKILASGVRIFTDGRDPKSLASLKADRTRARQARRMRDRYKQRRTFLMSELVKNGLMPQDETARKALEKEDPYHLRAKALDERIEPHMVGRALFHLNQRRGFKSNRKSSDGEDGVVRSSVEELLEKLQSEGVRTLGEFLAKRRHYPDDNPKRPDTVRARRRGTKTSDLYDLYPARHMLEEEFDAIWDSQAKFDPKTFSGSLRNRLRSIIFHQRPLKPQPVGKCTLIPDEPRSPSALPSSQRFRIYQEVNNLQWMDKFGEVRMVRDHLEARDKIVEALEKSRKRTFEQIAKILAKSGLAGSDVKFNFESERRDHLKGNLTSCEMGSEKRLGKKAWHGYSHSEQEEIINLILDDEQEDEDVIQALTNKYGLSEANAKASLNATLSDRRVNLSTKAINLLLPLMKDEGLQYHEAVKKAGLGSHSDLGYHESLRECLPYYGEVCRGHVMGEGENPDGTEEERFGAMPNPTVHIALNQLRRVYNDLIRTYRAPAEVVIEVARDLPLGADGRRDLDKRQKRNQERNDHAREILRKYGQSDNRLNRQRVLLWEELNDDPTGRTCPFSGDQISINKLFSDSIEIEHLLPFSRTLDDSMANKTLCTRTANRDKGNRTPHEAFGSNPKGYSWERIIARAQELPGNKRWRFQSDAMQRFEEENDFLARQLNDTRYISRISREYLECVVHKNKIWVVTGRLTALLRTHWGLNGILVSGPRETGMPEHKYRDDHRHHAVDAIVVGMTSRAMLKKVSSAAKHAEQQFLEKLFTDKRFDPWKDFREDVVDSVSQIVVSHRRRNKDQGQLHNLTAYGLTDPTNGHGPQLVVHRIPVTDIDNRKSIEKIRNKSIRKDLLDITEGLENKKEILEAVCKWCEKREIRRLRICELLTVIPIVDKSGKPYKGYKGDSNAYYDIYRNPGSEMIESEIVTTYNANQKKFIPEWQKKHPTATLVMRLRMNDMVELDFGGQRKIMRVKKLSKGRIMFVEHLKAGATVDDQRTYSPKALMKANAVFLDISPSGRIMRRYRDGLAS